MKHLHVVLAGMVLLLAACQSGKYELKFHPANGAVYSLHTNSTGTIGMKVLGQTVETSFETSVISRAQFDTLPDGQTAVDFSYEDYKIGPTTVATDSMRQQVSPLEDSAGQQILELIRKARFSGRLNQQGKLVSKTGADSMWKVIEASLQPLSEPVRSQLATALKPLVNDDMLVGIMDQSFYVLPGKRVDVGDKWRNQIRMQSVMNMTILNEFELLSVKNNVAEIGVKAKITNTDSKVALSGLAMAGAPHSQQDVKNGFDVFGMKLEAHFKGTQEGVVYVDMGTGIMQAAKLHQVLDGHFKFNGMELPMLLDMKNEYKTARR
ncbi:MAG: DUF6263 family protein [Chitinophagaceae bacterium]|nr:DUF6263 family protein [Chitinophagaceae bacterium]